MAAIGKFNLTKQIVITEFNIFVAAVIAAADGTVRQSLLDESLDGFLTYNVTCK